MPGCFGFESEKRLPHVQNAHGFYGENRIKMAVIELSESDIINGFPRNAFHCAVAMKLRDVSPGLWKVTKRFIKRLGREGYICVRTPVIVRDFITEYDSGDMMPAPITFEIPIPEIDNPSPPTHAVSVRKEE